MLQEAQNKVTRTAIADHIASRLAHEAERLRRDFAAPGLIPSCHLDDLLPDAMARAIYAAFPPIETMMFKNTLRERKYVSAQMNSHDPIIGEAVYAFQDERVVRLVAEITGLRDLEPDVDLYAGGISTM